MWFELRWYIGIINHCEQINVYVQLSVIDEYSLQFFKVLYIWYMVDWFPLLF